VAAPSGNRDQELRDLLALARRHGINSDDLDDVVHEVVSEQATQINNGGLEAQLSYLIDAIGPAKARATLYADSGNHGDQTANYGTPRQGGRP
jgi:hypothetical protein